MDDIVAYFRSYIPWANPNPLIVSLGDKLLGLDKHLYWAVWRDDGPTADRPTPAIISFEARIKVTP